MLPPTFIDAAISSRCVQRLNRDLQTLGRPECDFLACLDLNGFCDFASTAERAGNVGYELFCSDSARTKA